MKKHTIGNLKLTTVKVFDDKYQKFKKKTMDSDMTLQKLVNRSLSLYLVDESYKQLLDDMIQLQVSGSSF
jgi:hypothetical protein